MGHRKAKRDAPIMKGERGRSPGTGRLRKKRGDTRASTLEKEYGVELSVRPNTHLDTMRKKTGETSVQGVIKKLKE